MNITLLSQLYQNFRQAHENLNQMLENSIQSLVGKQIKFDDMVGTVTNVSFDLITVKVDDKKFPIRMVHIVNVKDIIETDVNTNVSTNDTYINKAVVEAMVKFEDVLYDLRLNHTEIEDLFRMVSIDLEGKSELTFKEAFDKYCLDHNISNRLKEQIPHKEILDFAHQQYQRSLV